MKLSVLLTAYNHERYIAKAIESALGQRTDFAYEIVVGEDCSTDGTADVVRAYAARHPGKVRVLPRPARLGMYRNYLDAYRACRGAYVAVLDGDDYWLSPYKLQCQVDFLDSHPECSLCFHNALILFEDGSGRPEHLYCRPDQPERVTLEDLLHENVVPVCAMTFRNGLVPEPPAWVGDLVCADWAFCLLLAEHGPAGYLPDVMAVIRKLSSGAWTGIGAEARVQSMAAMYERVNEHLGFRYDALVRALVPKWMALLWLERLYAGWGGLTRGWDEEYRRRAAERQAAVAGVAAERERALAAWWEREEQAERERAAAVGALSARLEEAEREWRGAAREAAALRRVVEGQGAWLGALAEAVRSAAERGAGLGARLRDVAPRLERARRELSRWQAVAEAQDAARAAIPDCARVLVVSKGDDELLALGGGRQAGHFPQDEGGGYLGHHPADGAEAVAHLEALRQGGAEYLLFPGTSRWWLEHYADFRRHLDARYPRAWDDGRCVIFRLTAEGTAPARGEGPRQAPPTANGVAARPGGSSAAGGPARPAAFSVIVCSRDPDRYEAVTRNYRDALGGDPVEVIGIHDARSLCEGYNRAVRRSTGDYLIFSHDDVEVLAPDLRAILEERLARYDVVGVAGTTRLIDPVWDAAGMPYVFGQVAHLNRAEGGYDVVVWGAPARAVGGIQALDGLFLGVNRRVFEALAFDEATFDGFHLYDLDFTFAAHLAGFELAVCTDIPVLHASTGSFDAAWRRYAERFREKYRGRLFPMGPRLTSRPVVRVRTREEVLEVMGAPHRVEA